MIRTTQDPMSNTVTVTQLKEYAENAKEKISAQKSDIIALYGLVDLVPTQYAFMYRRCQNIGLQAINRFLSEVAWLPMQLSPDEIEKEVAQSMKRWVVSPFARQKAPTDKEFGNQFIHVLTRCATLYGVESQEFKETVARIAALFVDVQCLVGIIYYVTWLQENGIEKIGIDLGNKPRIVAEELSMFMASPQMYKYVKPANTSPVQQPQ